MRDVSCSGERLEKRYLLRINKTIPHYQISELVRVILFALRINIELPHPRLETGQDERTFDAAVEHLRCSLAAINGSTGFSVGGKSIGKSNGN